MTTETNVGAQRPLALVTGASSGIGLALAHELVDRGCDVVIAAEDEGIKEAAAQLLSRGAVVYPVR
ncbi:MAG TPA: SDR family NAD(P)-dependent oxidoreductase, partial [Actinospica sp.]|nr:SDR family NAD(P)-dependent oxidoreductase [Actinospica sp.]